MIQLPHIKTTLQIITSDDAIKPYATVRLPVQSWSMIDSAFKTLRATVPDMNFKLRIIVDRDNVIKTFVVDWSIRERVIDHTTAIIRLLNTTYQAYDIAAVLAQVENLPVCQSRMWVDAMLEASTPVNVKGAFNG